MMGREVFVLSAGAVSACGPDGEDLAESVSSSRSAIGEITAFDTPEDSPALGAVLEDFEVSRYFPSIKTYVDRCTALALKAALEALEELPPGAAERFPVGLVFGSRFACLETVDLYASTGLKRGWRFAPPFLFIHSYANTPAAVVHIELKLKGYSNVFSGYEGAGAAALADGFAAVSTGAADLLLAGASEGLGPLRYAWHHAAGELGTFERPKEGSEPGEGAAMLLLASPEAAAGAEGALGKVRVEPRPPEGAAEVDVTAVTGRCAAAQIPLSAAAFLLSGAFDAGSEAAFPLGKGSGWLVIEKGV
ncbi:MAG: hypothetical protein DRP90_01600 [Planctomycetota bacterium]|nr:MAG: hypothetical protein DRP90_01600 [Planctomycetota bacterium]